MKSTVSDTTTASDRARDKRLVLNYHLPDVDEAATWKVFLAASSMLIVGVLLQAFAWLSAPRLSVPTALGLCTVTLFCALIPLFMAASMYECRGRTIVIFAGVIELAGSLLWFFGFIVSALWSFSMD